MITNESEKSTSSFIGDFRPPSISHDSSNFNAQTANAAYGNEVIKPNAQCGKTGSCDGGAANWGGAVSSAAQDGSGHGIADFRANGNKLVEIQITTKVRRSKFSIN